MKKYVKKLVRKLFSTKDEAFWKEYTNMKAQGGKYPVLGTQGIQYNKTNINWKFAEKFSLMNDEFYECLTEIDIDPPYLILDVREDIEFDLFKLPLKNKSGREIPIIYKNMDDINHGNFDDLPLDKYIICVDSIGLRSRRASQILYYEGYLTLYVEGGYDMLLSYLDNKLI